MSWDKIQHVFLHIFILVPSFYKGVKNLYFTMISQFDVIIVKNNRKLLHSASVLGSFPSMANEIIFWILTLNLAGLYAWLEGEAKGQDSEALKLSLCVQLLLMSVATLGIHTYPKGKGLFFIEYISILYLHLKNPKDSRNKIT